MEFDTPYKLDLVNDPIEELYLWEFMLSQQEEKHRESLQWISEAIVRRQGTGDTISCYSETTEHALHPEAA